MTRAIRIVRVETLAALVAVAAFGCKKPDAENANKKAALDADVPVAVSLVAVHEVKAPRQVMLSGTLIGSEEAQVAAGAAGKVIATYIERGSVVKKGAVLAKLDSRAVSAQAEVAAADAEASKIQAQQSKLDCERTEHMFQKGAISKADYDKAHTQCEASKWTVSSAEARRTLTAEALRDTEIRAPFSGMVVERSVTAGEYVQPASRVVTLVATDSLRVEITVPEADIPLVKQGMQVDFRTSGGGETLYHGKIRYVGPSVRRQSRDAIVEAVFANSSHELRPGMFVTARIALGEETLPAVPAKAVRADGELKHVYVAAGGRLEDRLVPAREPLDGQIPIVSGVKTGEQVVAELTPDVRDGAKVK